MGADDGTKLVFEEGDNDGDADIGSEGAELGIVDGEDEEFALGRCEGSSEVVCPADGAMLGSRVNVLAKPTGAGLSGVSKQIARRAIALGPYMETVI